MFPRGLPQAKLPARLLADPLTSRRNGQSGCHEISVTGAQALTGHRDFTHREITPRASALSGQEFSRLPQPVCFVSHPFRFPHPHLFFSPSAGCCFDPGGLPS